MSSAKVGTNWSKTFDRAGGGSGVKFNQDKDPVRRTTQRARTRCNISPAEQRGLFWESEKASNHFSRVALAAASL
jgi:hypothetical protein